MSFDRAFKRAARRILSRGRPGIYQQLDGFETRTTFMIDEGVDPFAENQLNTNINDLKTVATILAEDISTVRKGERIVLDDGGSYTTVHVVKSDGYTHKVIVR